MGRRLFCAAVMLALACASAPPVAAHVGSPDVFVDTTAGPYRALITVRPPSVIPGVADVEVRVLTPGARRVLIVPTPMTGAGAGFAPTPERVEPSRQNPQVFAGSLWMMTAGAWQVRVTVQGDHGEGSVAIPVPTLPQATKGMSRTLSVILWGLMLLLSAGAIAIVAAIARESSRVADEAVTPRAKRRGRLAAAIATVVVTTIIWLGNAWWNVEASGYARYVYRPIEGRVSIDPANRLTLTLTDPGWISLRRLDDLVNDHGHVVHFFIMSPSLDRFWHLHAEPTGDAAFGLSLPTMPSGRYDYFADVVHATGISETVAGALDSAGVPGTAVAGDDAEWRGTVSGETTESPLADGGRVRWLREAAPIGTRELTLFTFRLEDSDGAPASDLELYMGMPAHAVFVRKDRQVFAHVHPSGSAPMAAMSIANGHTMTHDAGMQAATSVPSTVTFPYGVPSPGEYRVFVQFKRHGRIQTAAFDFRATQ
jgi:hypothetical protein